MERDNEKKSMVEILDYISSKSNLKMEPMPKAKIKVICTAFPDRKIPRAYLEFLTITGNYFQLWNGSDYVMVSKNNIFIDLSKYVKNDPEINTEFQKYGFSYDECFFFLSHQGNTYCFFRFDDGDDPTVYILDYDAVGEQQSRPTFTEFVIESYNGYVRSNEMLENPWRKCRDIMAERVLRDMKSIFLFDSGSDVIEIPYDHDVYEIVGEYDLYLNCLHFLNPILEKSITNIRSLYIYTRGVMYLYFPLKNTICEDSVDMNIYRDKTFIMDREYKWGWFTVGGNVYVFGDRFKTLIRENLDKFSLSEL